MAIADVGGTWAPRGLSVLRFMSGLLLLQHGTAKLLGFPPGAVPGNFTLASMPGYAGFIEFICGILLILGLFTRPAAFIASGMTAVAYFYAHFPQGFFPILNRGELAVLYCFVFLYIAVAGPGPWSIDAARRAA
jgi:putative oxidoreductase